MSTPVNNSIPSSPVFKVTDSSQQRGATASAPKVYSLSVRYRGETREFPELELKNSDDLDAAVSQAFNTHDCLRYEISYGIHNGVTLKDDLSNIEPGELTRLVAESNFD